MYRVLFQIGPFSLYSYGLCVAAGFLISTILVLRDSKRFGVSTDIVFDSLIVVLASGLIGGRLLFVFINREFYLQYPLRIFMFYEGGLAFQGALVTAVFCGVLFAWVKKFSFWKVSDLIAPYIALGQAVGRIGCFLNGCCYGKVIEKGPAITFPGETVMRIPTQLYSSVLLVVIFAVLVSVREKRRFDGCVFTLYLILYAVLRFFMDFMRGDELALFCGIRVSQGISIVMFVCGAVMYAMLANADRKRRDRSLK